MKLFFICIFVVVLGLAQGVDVKCRPQDPDDFDDFDDAPSCVITEPVTIKTGEKVNISSDINSNSIIKLKFISKISTVPSEIFEQLPNLETFELYASVNVLNKGNFEKAGKLERLVIDSLLKRIPAGVLSSAKNLESLTLSRNQISEIEDNAFNGLNALLNLYLYSNKLTIIKQNTFNGLEKLEILDLHSNQIETIEENALNLPNLRKFVITNNKLTSFPDNLFAATPLLEYFYAESNQINHIGRSLYELKSLRYLFLNRNNPTDIDFVAFSQLPKLEILYLNKIGLTSENISRIEIKEPSKSVLTYLSLADNELTNNDDWKKLAIFPELETIKVQNNKYSKIDFGDKTLRQQFPKLTKVFVSSGEWSCDWLGNFVESSKKDGITIITGSSNMSGKNVDGIGCV